MSSLKREKEIIQHHKAKTRHNTIYACPMEFHDGFVVPHFEKTEEEKTFIDEALGDNFIFSHLNAEERSTLIGAMQKEVVKKGTNVIVQGETTSNGTDCFYILQEGSIEYILADGEHVGVCETGGSFGELALLYNSPRAATCRAAKRSVLWKVDQRTFRHMLARQACEFHGDLCSTIEKIPLFEHLGPMERGKIAEALTPVFYSEGERIVTKGDPGEVFYIIQQGTVKCHDIGLGDAKYADQLLLKSGEWFGERALLTGEPRAANVTAVSDVDCLCLDRATFELVIGSLHESIELGLKKKFLETLPIFTNSNFDPHEIDLLASKISEECYMKGTKLSEVGKPYRQDLWIIEKGRIVVTNKHGSIFTLESGDYFGDKSIKGEKGHISSHTAICEENTTCYILSRSDIEEVIGDIHRLGEFKPFTSSKFVKTLKRNDLDLHRVLGMG